MTLQILHIYNVYLVIPLPVSVYSCIITLKTSCLSPLLLVFPLSLNCINNMNSSYILFNFLCCLCLQPRLFLFVICLLIIVRYLLLKTAMFTLLQKFIFISYFLFHTYLFILFHTTWRSFFNINMRFRVESCSFILPLNCVLCLSEAMLSDYPKNRIALTLLQPILRNKRGNGWPCF